MAPIDDVAATTEVVGFLERTLVLNESTLLEISKHHSAAIVGIGSENVTIIMNEVGFESMEEHLVNEVYIVIALTLMVFSSITCVCLCLIYHKYQQWHQHVLESRPAQTSPIVPPLDTDSLPSYTIVTGLPSYEEALEQLRQIRLNRKTSAPLMKYTGAAPNDEIDGPGLVTFTRLSIGDLVKFHKQDKCKFLC